MYISLTPLFPSQLYFLFVILLGTLLLYSWLQVSFSFPFSLVLILEFLIKNYYNYANIYYTKYKFVLSKYIFLTTNNNKYIQKVY